GADGEELAAKVRATGADIGFATDPDADRLGLVDESGRALSEEYTLALAADWLLERERAPVVVNLSTTSAMDDICGKHGVPLHRTAVGEVNVVERMLRVGAVVGGEGNGGVILPALHPGRDAVGGMALILHSVADSGATLSQRHASLPAYHMVKRSQPLARPVTDTELAELARAEFGGPLDTQDGVKVTLADGWVHVRRSNTEPIVRAIAESRD